MVLFLAPLLSAHLAQRFQALFHLMVMLDLRNALLTGRVSRLGSYINRHDQHYRADCFDNQWFVSISISITCASQDRLFVFSVSGVSSLALNNGVVTGAKSLSAVQVNTNTLTASGTITELGVICGCDS